MTFLLHIEIKNGLLEYQKIKLWDWLHEYQNNSIISGIRSVNFFYLFNGCMYLQYHVFLIHSKRKKS